MQAIRRSSSAVYNYHTQQAALSLCQLACCSRLCFSQTGQNFVFLGPQGMHIIWEMATSTRPKTELVAMVEVNALTLGILQTSLNGHGLITQPFSWVANCTIKLTKIKTFCHLEPCTVSPGFGNLGVYVIRSMLQDPTTATSIKYTFALGLEWQ